MSRWCDGVVPVSASGSRVRSKTAAAQLGMVSALGEVRIQQTLFNAAANTSKLNIGSILLKPDGLKVISVPKTWRTFLRKVQRWGNARCIGRQRSSMSAFKNPSLKRNCPLD